MKNSSDTARTVLITGASSGFGKLAVPLLLQDGYRVMAGMRGGATRLQEIFPEECRQYAGRLSAVDLHMERPETMVTTRAAVEREFGGKLDVLVNNAGFGLLGPFEDQTPEQLRYQMEVNFFGPAFLTQALLPLIKTARGRILNISSVAGRMTFPLYSSYNASKHALEAHTEGLAYDLSSYGVQVGLIEPGAFGTEFGGRSMVISEHSLSESSPNHSRIRRFESILKKSITKAPHPIRVARVIARLASARRVPIRTVVGLDARALLLLRWITPEDWRVRAMGWGFRQLLKTPALPAAKAALRSPDA